MGVAQTRPFIDAFEPWFFYTFLCKLHFKSMIALLKLGSKVQFALWNFEGFWLLYNKFLMFWRAFLEQEIKRIFQNFRPFAAIFRQNNLFLFQFAAKIFDFSIFRHVFEVFCIHKMSKFFALLIFGFALLDLGQKVQFAVWHQRKKHLPQTRF